jgi:hypothetical protein
VGQSENLQAGLADLNQCLKAIVKAFSIIKPVRAVVRAGIFFVPKRKKDPVLSLYRTFSALQHQNRVVFEVIHFS